MPHYNETPPCLNIITKPITSERTEEDGVRLSVMSRHTRTDGITPDPEIINSSFDEHIPKLGPPPELIGDYYKRGLSWNGFAEQYVAYLENTPEQIDNLLCLLVIRSTITLLCIESKPEHCHRRLLAEHCQKRYGRIALDIQ